MTPRFPTPPVLLVVFNRLETTLRVMQRIAAAAPKQLFVAADGPRPGKPGDAEKCEVVRGAVRASVTWDCEVKYLERDTNLGCGRAPSGAITWFFENVDEGIILEDDCLPSEQFFPFCAAVLERYRDEERVGHVGGFNCQFGRVRGNASYYFSRYFHGWGWATWRRAWKDFDFTMADFPRFEADGVLDKLFERPAVREFWRNNFAAVLEGRQDIWDYQWVYCNLKKERLAVVPNWNMVENMGSGGDATHTARWRTRMPLVAGGDIAEITHPNHIAPCLEADDYTFRTHTGLGTFHDVKRAAKKVLRAAHLYRGHGK